MAVLPLLLDADPSQSCRWIENFLHHHLFHEAAFLAERLPAFPEVEGGRVLELWAEALLSAGEPSRVRHQLQGFHSSRSLSPRVLYLLALACIRLEHYDEAEVALLAGNIDLLEKWRNGQMQPLEHVVEGAAGAYQLGRAAEGMGRKHQALDCYAACLKQCPYMWGAFERFSWLSLCRQDGRPGQSPRDFVDAALNPSNKASTPLSGACVATPGEDIVARGWTPRAPRKRRRSRSFEKRQKQKAPGKATSPSKMRAIFSPRKGPGSPSAPEVLTKLPQLPLADGSPSPGPKAAGCSTSVSSTSAKEMMAVSVLKGVGEALHAVHRFHCQDALEILSKLPSHERESAFCQDLAARCNFELQNYRDAAILYKRCSSLHKFHSSLGLEYYSTTLWHLGDRLELGQLSRQVLEWSRLRPQAWCVAGNCFSLEKDHEQAVRCFERAIQLNPKHAYARTLLGHELVALEKYDKAIQQYRSAIDVDPRNYGAWWGLGRVCQSQEDLVQAKYNFLRAVEINGSNQVLRTSLGMVLQALGEPQRALQLFNRAVESSHCRALALFQKACILSSQKQHVKAADELVKARCLAPREPCIHVQMGRVQLGLGNVRKALQHFTHAMDLCAASGDRQLIAAAEEELRNALPAEARSTRSLTSALSDAGE